MKKGIIIGLAVAAMIATNVNAWSVRDTYEAMTPDENLAPITFRGLDWSDDCDAVIQKLMAADGLTEKDFYCNDKKTFLTTSAYQIIGGQELLTILSFNDNSEGLRTAEYSFYGEHSTAQQYYLDFADLYSALVSIYGEPTLNADQWITDTYMGDEQHYGDGILKGCMEFYRGWMASDGSAIVLHISGDNDALTSFGISYLSPGLVFPPIESGL